MTQNMGLARLFAVAALAVATGSASSLAYSRVPDSQPVQDTITIEQQTLYRGCNDIVVIAPVGTAWSAILGHVQDQWLVLGLWKRDNAEQRYRSEYFSNDQAPLDGAPATTEQAEGLWFCVSAETAIG